MAHTFRQKSQVNDQTGNPVTHNHTPGATATVCVLTITIAGASDRTGGAPTIDGTTAEQVGTAINATECSIETWYVCKAFSGSQFSVSVPNAGGLSLSLEVLTADAGSGYSSAYNDFDEEAQTGNVNGMTLTPSAAAVGDFAVSRVASGENAPSSVTCAYGTETYANDHGAYSSAGRYHITTASGAQSIPWVWSADDGCGQAVVFKSVAGATTYTITTGADGVLSKADQTKTPGMDAALNKAGQTKTTGLDGYKQKTFYLYIGSP